MKSAGAAVCIVISHVSVVCVCHLVRKYWEAEYGKKGDRFDVEAMVGAHGSAQHKMMLSRAVNLYESLFDNSKGVTQILWLLLQLPAYMRIALAGR